MQYLPERLGVHAVLVTGDTVAQALITHVGGRDSAGIAPLQNAIVRLSSGRDTIQLVQGTGRRCANAYSYPIIVDINLGCYSARIPAGLQSGTTWQLRVDAGTLGSADGSVTMPSRPSITSPLSGARVPSRQSFGSDSAGDFSVRWSGVSPGQWVQLSANQPNPQCSLNMGLGAPLNFGPTYTTEADSLRVRIYDGSCQVNSTGIPATITVLAFDSVYTLYRKNLMLGSAANPNAWTGITGAVGVLSGAARAVVPVIVARE